MIKTKSRSIVALLCAFVLMFALCVVNFAGVTYAAEGDLTITFNVDNVTTTQTVAPGSSPVKPTAPTKTGYTFKGWSLSSNGSVFTGSLPTVSADTTFYAVFIPLKYEITFEYFNNKGMKTSVIVLTDYGATPEIPEIPQEVNGASFSSWNITVSSCTGKATYKATYTYQYYTVEYVYSPDMSVNIAKSGVEDLTTEQAPEVEGKKFLGWSTTKEKSDIVSSSYRISSSAKLYAIYGDTAEGIWNGMSTALQVTTCIVGGIIVLVLLGAIIRKIRF